MAEARQSALLIATICDGDFWKEGGEAERYLAERRQAPEEFRWTLRDLTVRAADRVALTMQGAMESPALRAELGDIDDKGDWDDDDVRAVKALLIANGLLR